MTFFRDRWFQKIRGTRLGAPIIRRIVFEGLCLGLRLQGFVLNLKAPISGKVHQGDSHTSSNLKDQQTRLRLSYPDPLKDAKNGTPPQHGSITTLGNLGDHYGVPFLGSFKRIAQVFRLLSDVN